MTEGETVKDHERNVARPYHDVRVGDEALDLCLPVSRPVAGTQEKMPLCLHDVLRKQPVILTFY